MMRLTLILLGVVLTAGLAGAATLYVSPQGQDTWSGALAAPNAAKTDGPLATLQRAREEVRKVKASGPVTVQVRGGLYALPETFALGAEDSGTAAAPIIWQAYPGEKPVLLGGKTINNWVPHQGQVLKADMTAAGLKGKQFRQLFLNGVRQHLARTPNFDPQNPYGGGWAYADGKPVPMYADVPGEDKRTFQYRPGDVPEMARPTEAEVFVFARYNWWNNVVPIAALDRASRTVKLASDCSYPIRPGDRYYLRNVFEALDSPGEWYLDNQTGTLYFWPPTALRANSVSVPVLENLVSLNRAAHVTLQGFVMEGCDGHGVVISGGSHCTLAGCTVRNTVGRWDWGLSAVTVSGTDNRVVGCDIHDTGGHGISLNGGDRQTLTPARNVADNNYIHHVGQMYKQGVGIAMHGVGLKATHNLIHDGPRMGIMFGGNNLLIEYNEIRHMNLETSDTGAVYTGGRDWISSRGTVIRYNYFHDILGYGQDETGRWVSPFFAWGVYLDDNAGGVDVIGNLLVRCPRALIHLHNGRDNVIENNIMVDGTLQQLEYNGWTDKHPYWTSHFKTMEEGYNLVKGQPAWRNMRFMDIPPEKAVLPDGKIMAHNVFRRNIMYYKSGTAQAYRLGNVNLDFNEFDSNLIYNAGGAVTMGLKGVAPADQWAQWQQQGEDRTSVVADPLFVDAAKDDYRLRPDSPALKLGFQRIPVWRIGPYQSAQRASWPIRQAEGARERPLVSQPVREVPPPQPRYTMPVSVPRASAAPAINGDPSTWAGVELKVQEDPGRNVVKSPAATAKVTYDAGSLYVGLTVPLRPGDKVAVGNSWGQHDGAEVCVQNASGRQLGPTFVIHGFLDGKFESVTDAGAPLPLARKVAEGTRYAAVVRGDQWTATWALPWVALGVRPQPGVKLNFNVGLHRTATREWVMWGGTLAQTWVVARAGVLELR